MDQFIKHEPQTLADLQQAQQQHQQFAAVPGVPPHFNSYDPQGLTQIPSFDQGVDLNPFLSPSAQASNTLPPTTQPTKKKNQYPCPVAKAYECNEFFTTSGHAARHAKKHTGKKDAICPECKKAFTRKDNMEQHRRTHSSVRGQAKAAAAAGAAATTTEEKQAKRAKQAQKKVNNQANRESSLSATAAAAAAATVSIPQMNNLIPAQMPGMSMAQGMPHSHHNNLASAPVASMDMGMAGMLDPRLMAGGPDMAFSADLAQFEQQLLLQNAANGFPRTEMHQSSYDGAMQQPHTPDSVLDEPQDASQQNGQGSPSVAPALDALALAASRQ